MDMGIQFCVAKMCHFVGTMEFSCSVCVSKKSLRMLLYSVGVWIKIQIGVR